ncbi:hypothetical protein PoB_003580800 [Plakobranchus ocellatus]|uniref:Uncharacterized protein n=1 Tax=Plakobranchus ocellatus TaxID=259542 RepID=A0AAV4AR56_9GAST|nr:hypothetical protein PoB_003580800 [Plakobranchus ocellatus]
MYLPALTAALIITHPTAIFKLHHNNNKNNNYNIHNNNINNTNRSSNKTLEFNQVSNTIINHQPLHRPCILFPMISAYPSGGLGPLSCSSPFIRSNGHLFSYPFVLWRLSAPRASLVWFCQIARSSYVLFS